MGRLVSGPWGRPSGFFTGLEAQTVRIVSPDSAADVVAAIIRQEDPDQPTIGEWQGPDDLPRFRIEQTQIVTFRNIVPNVPSTLQLGTVAVPFAEVHADLLVVDDLVADLVTATSAAGGGAAGALGPEEIRVEMTQDATAIAPIRAPGYLSFRGETWDGLATSVQEIGRLGMVIDTIDGAGLPVTYRHVLTDRLGAIQWDADEVGNTLQQGTLSVANAAAVLGGTALTTTGSFTIDPTLDLLVEVTDNRPRAVAIAEGARDYLVVDTSDVGASMSFGNATTNPTYGFLGSGLASFAGAISTTGIDINGGDLTEIDELVFNDAGGAASATGRLRRNGVRLVYHNGTSSLDLVMSGANGFPVRTGAGTFSARTITVVAGSAAALSVAFGDGVGGNPAFTVDAGLVSLAAFPTVADRIAYSTAADVWAETPLTAFARTVLDDVDAVTARATLGVAIGVDVQAWDADLDALAALDGTAGYLVKTGANAYARRTLLGTANQVIISNGDGTVDNPVFSLPQSIHTGASPQFTGGRYTGDLVVEGNLRVQGDSVIFEAEHELIEDNHLYLGHGYGTAVARTGGFVINYLPIATTDTVAAGGFTAGVGGVSNPTVATVGAATFAVGQFIQIEDATDEENNGLFEVLSHAANVLTIRGIGLTATVEDFTQNQFTTEGTVAGTIRRVTVSSLRAGTDGTWETAAGATTGLTFVDFVLEDRAFTAGAGLTGGGDLSADRTFDVGAGDGILVGADSVEVNEAFAFVWSVGHTMIRSDATVAAVLDAHTYARQTSAVAANDIGLRNLFQIETDAGGAAKDAGAVLVVWVDAADGTRTSALRLQTVTSAAALATQFEIGGSSLGFFGVAAAARAGAAADLKDALVSYGLLTDGGATPLDLDGGTLACGTGSQVGMGAGGAATLVGVANVNVTAVANVGAGPDDLITYTLPANSMNANGKSVHIRAWGTTANNANAKTVRLDFGATAILTTALTVNVAGVWSIEAVVVRTGAAAQDRWAELHETGVGTADLEVGAAAEDTTAGIVIKCVADTVTDNGDIVQEGLLVEFLN